MAGRILVGIKIGYFFAWRNVVAATYQVYPGGKT